MAIQKTPDVQIEELYSAVKEIISQSLSFVKCLDQYFSKIGERAAFLRSSFHFISVYFRSVYSSYTARGPPIYFGRVLAQIIFACPIFLTDVRTGTATAFKCIPISVPPISIPAPAFTVSIATGSSKLSYATLANEPPAFG